MTTEYESYEKLAEKFLNDDLIQKCTTGYWKYSDQPAKVEGAKVTKVRKNKDGSVRFYNGKSRINKVEDVKE